MAIVHTTENEFCPSSPEEWRNWLENNHKTASHVWLIFFKKAAKKPTLTWSQAVDHALCFGWIDSVKKQGTKKVTSSFSAPENPTVHGQK